MSQVPGGDDAPHDIVVVGAGAMGLLAARLLARDGHEVLLLESGGPEPDRLAGGRWAPHTPPGLAVGDALGQGLGGTGRWWAGQCAQLPAADLLAEPARGDVGWPITADELERWREPALAEVGLTEKKVTRIRRRAESRFPDVPSGFQMQPTVYMPQFRLDRQWSDEVRSTPRIHVRTDTRVHSVRRQGQHLEVRMGAPEGASFTIVRAKGVVIAAGALGNAELLLRSRSAGLPVSDTCGRFLSEHLTSYVAELNTAPVGALATALGTAFLGRTKYWPKLALDPVERRRRNLPAVAADLNVVYDPAVVAARSTISRSHQDVGAAQVAGLVRAAAGGALARARGSAVHRGAVKGFSVLLNVEQPPRSANRLEWVDDGSTWGRSTISWEIGRDDLESARRVAELLTTTWPSRLGRLDLLPDLGDDDALRERTSPAYHHSGVTRMGTGRSDSVVDSHLGLHDEPSIRVLGASCLPSASWVNPTFTAWELAMRSLAGWQP